MLFWKQSSSPARQYVQRMDALLDAYAAAKSFSGVVRVTRGADVIYERALGLASVERNIPTITC